MHKAQLILDAVYTKLNALVTDSTIKTLNKNSALKMDSSQHPLVVIRMGDDDPVSRGAQHIDSDLSVHTDIYVSTTSDDLDSLTLAVRLAIHKALMADITQGLGFVIDTQPQGQSEPDYSGEGEDYAGGTRLSWKITYRSNLQDPSQ